jgi:hypothetical protein
MFTITDKKFIYITRGDVASLDVTIYQEDGSYYVFQKGDEVRLTVVEKNNYDNVLIQKTSKAIDGDQYVTITLEKEDTRFSQIISKPVDYWYEIELNPDNDPQTIIGHDEDGPKIFRIYPEGGTIK